MEITSPSRHLRARRFILSALVMVAVFPGCFVWQWLLETTAEERQSARNIRALGGSVTTRGEMSFQIAAVQLPGITLDKEQMQQLAEDLQSIRHLRLLTISGNKFPLADLAQLQRLEELEYLDFFETDISDEDVAYLNQLNRLKSLRLHKTQMTTEGVAQLETALPGCEIHFMPRMVQTDNP
jgi:hypothetical protein